MPRRHTTNLAQPESRPRAVPEAAARQGDLPGYEAEGMPPGPAQRHDGLTPERQRIFFETLAATASVSRAARACGLSRQALYVHRNRADAPAFREAWDVAMSCAINLLGDIAFDRAVEGVEEPVFWKGEQVGTRRRYNDNLLMTLLRVRDPFAFAPQSDLKHWAGARTYFTRPRLDGALAALDAEAAGSFEHRYDDDPGGALDPAHPR